MRFTESIKNIAIALAQFQGVVTAAPKDAINPHFRKKYSTLDSMITTIRPALNQCGLSFIQNPAESIDGEVGAYTMLIHESGETITFDPVYVPLEKKTAQGIGSAMTYAKRYSLGTAIGISTDEDDDGNSIEPERKQPRQRNNNTQRTQQKQQQTKQPQQRAYATAETMTSIGNKWNVLGFDSEKLNVQLFSLYGNVEITPEQANEFEAKLDTAIKKQQQAQPEQEETVEEPVQLMTDKQRKKTFAIGRDKGLNSNQVKEVCYYYNKVDSMKDMTEKQAEDTQALLEATSGAELIAMIGETVEETEAERKKKCFDGLVGATNTMSGWGGKKAI